MIYGKIIAYLAANYDIDEEQVSKETTFEELKLEEEDIIDMLFELSRELDIIADEDDIYGITDIGGLTDRLGEICAEK